MSDRYFSEIAFVNTLSSPIIQKKVFYVQGDKITGFFLDKNDYLKNLYWTSRKDDIELDILSNGYISTIQQTTKYCSYVKVIRDNQNTQFEDQIMIFQFGTAILKKIENYFDGSPVIFEQTFAIRIKITSGFPNFEDSCFTNNNIELSDPNLNLELEPKLQFKTVTLPLQLERREKLERLKTL
jgi:hypothetical protein